MNQGAAVFDFTGNFAVGGDFNLSAGDNGYNLGTFNGAVNGNVSVALGSGNDTVTLNLFVGNTVTVNLGAGADTFTATDQDSFYTAATIDLGVDSDLDTGTVTTTLAPFTTFLNVGGGDVTTAV